MNNRYMKRCSALLIYRQIQIKTTMRHCLTPIKMAIIKTTKDKFWQGSGEIKTFLCLMAIFIVNDLLYHLPNSYSFLNFLSNFKHLLNINVRGINK